MPDHNCIKHALQYVIGKTLDIPEHEDRGTHPGEAALVLREAGYALTIFDVISNIINGDGDIVTIKLDGLTPEMFDPCMVELERHAVAFIDGEFLDLGFKIEVDRSKILSYWVPSKIKSTP